MVVLPQGGVEDRPSDARKVLGLAAGALQLSDAGCGGRDVFVQSTSGNRQLKAGSRMLFEVPFDGTNSGGGRGVGAGANPLRGTPAPGRESAVPKTSVANAATPSPRKRKVTVDSEPSQDKHGATAAAASKRPRLAPVSVAATATPAASAVAPASKASRAGTKTASVGVWSSEDTCFYKLAGALKPEHIGFDYDDTLATRSTDTVMPGVISTIKALSQTHSIVVYSNQMGVEKNKTTHAAVQALFDSFGRQVGEWESRGAGGWVGGWAALSHLLARALSFFLSVARSSSMS